MNISEINREQAALYQLERAILTTGLPMPRSEHLPSQSSPDLCGAAPQPIPPAISPQFTRANQSLVRP